MKTLLVRADGGQDIGAGHIMRCLAIAQEWRARGGRVVFASAVLDPTLADRLEREHCETLLLDVERGQQPDAEKTRALAERLDAEWLLLDGYCFDAEYQRDVRGTSHMAMLDDTGVLGPYGVDLLVNQNLHADEAMYRNARGARLLLGPDHTLLRDEFLKHGEAQRSVPDVARRVLVTLGGSDVAGHTLKVLAALRQLVDPDLDFIVVVGASNPHANEIAASAATEARIKILAVVEDMASLMAWADLAICSGGSTVWELAYMGVPTIVGSVALVEERLAAGLVAHGLFTYLGSFADIEPADLATAIAGLQLDASARGDMGRRGNEVVDGGGRQRVVLTMNTIAQGRAYRSQRVGK